MYSFFLSMCYCWF